MEMTRNKEGATKTGIFNEQYCLCDLFYQTPSKSHVVDIDIENVHLKNKSKSIYLLHNFICGA